MRRLVVNVVYVVAALMERRRDWPEATDHTDDSGRFPIRIPCARRKSVCGEEVSYDLRPNRSWDGRGGQNRRQEWRGCWRRSTTRSRTCATS